MRISLKWQWAVLSFLVLYTAVAHSERDIQAVRSAGVKGGGRHTGSTGSAV